MVGKRKIENLRANIAKMARAAETNNQKDYHGKERFQDRIK